MSLFSYENVWLNDETATTKIRLLKLLEGEGEDEIDCELETVSLQGAPQYEALSYTWGPQTRQYGIKCNGEYFIVGRNLLTAIRRLISTTCPRLLWIDAICINQKDTDEKSVQVGLMRQIYQHSQRVVIWLGEEQWDTKSVAAVVNQLLEASRAQEAAKDERYYQELSKKDILEYGIPPLNHPGFKGLRYLLSSSWCDRAWVVQEVAVALDSMVLCGSRSFSMKDINAAISYIYLLDLETHLGFHFPTRFCTIWAESVSIKQGRHRTLLSLVKGHWLAKATQPQDKIFALMGLASDVGPNGLDFHINYNHSVDQVYTDFAKAVIRKNHNLQILGTLSSWSNKRSPDLPSWVPDWRVWNPNTFVFSAPETGQNRSTRIDFQAAKESKCFPVFDGNRMKLRGIILGTVVRIGRKMAAAESTSNMLWRFETWERIAKTRKKRMFKSKKIFLKMYAETITMGNCAGCLKDPEAEFGDFYENLEHLSDLYNRGQTFDPDFRQDEFKGHRFFEALTVGVNRALVRTGMGHLGLVTGMVDYGDKIALLAGGALPFVIRANGDDWQVVGDGYVHGVMTGKAFKENRCKDMWFI